MELNGFYIITTGLLSTTGLSGQAQPLEPSFRDETIEDLIDTNEFVLEQKLEEWVENGKDYPDIMRKFNRYKHSFSYCGLMRPSHV